MKFIALLTFLVCIVFSGMAETPETISCAVTTSDVVNIKDATKSRLYVDYKGRRYFFCSKACTSKFKAEPEKYEDNASIPIPPKDP